MDLPTLTDQWRVQKEALKQTQEALLQTEIQIYHLIKSELPEKGTTHFGDLKVVTGFTEKWDQDKIGQMVQTWPETVPNPFIIEYKVNRRVYDVAREMMPRLADCLTLTERKPSFSVEK